MLNISAEVNGSRRRSIGGPQAATQPIDKLASKRYFLGGVQAVSSLWETRPRRPQLKLMVFPEGAGRLDPQDNVL